MASCPSLKREPNDDELYVPLLKCGLYAASFDFVLKRAALRLPFGNCTDMTGAISYVKAVMPDVEYIMTFSGEERDMSYYFHYGEWSSREP